jgi:thioredoxin
VAGPAPPDARARPTALTSATVPPVRDVTDETFETDVLRAGKPVVVDFWAPWCGPCRAVTPVLEQLAGETEKVEFVKIDIDENPRVASRYDVLSLPTVMLFDGGSPKETLIGARPAGHFRKAFAGYL